MSERFDAVVVGARCAGSPLATLLARRGLRVTVVEQAAFPRDTLSSHLFEADGLAVLARLGLTERLRATGAPFADHVDLRVDDFHATVEWPQQPGDVGGMASIRRHVLDPILAQAAEEAGADVRMRTRVKGLVEEAGRVAGVRVDGPDGPEELRARLVVGADGRNSTVARLAGARKYNLVSNERMLYWGYFEGADPGPRPTFLTHRWDDRFVIAIPADNGLYQVLVWPELHLRERFREDLDAAYLEQAHASEVVAEIIGGARRVGKVYGAVRWVGFFRDPCGPGWVLTGDAGHFKDPGPGRGIADALIQAEALAPAVAEGLEGSDADLDGAMARWGRWRDDEFAEHYWFAIDTSKSGRVPLVLPELMRGLHRRGKLHVFLDLLNHRAKPTKVLGPPRAVGALGRALARGRVPRGEVIRESGSLMAEDLRRRRLNRRPKYAEPGLEAEYAGPTEVAEPRAAA